MRPHDEITYLVSGRSALLQRVLPLFRSPALLQLNRDFFIPHPDKEAVLHMLAYGLRGDWGPQFPPPNRPAPNYLGTPEAIRKCRCRLQLEVRAGRMVGSPGWTADTVCWFLGGDFFITPCGAVPKGEDPHAPIRKNVDSTRLSFLSTRMCRRNTLNSSLQVR